MHPNLCRVGGATLFAVDACKRHLAGQSPWASGFKFFVVAVSAAGLGYLIGLVVQWLFLGVSIPA